LRAAPRPGSTSSASRSSCGPSACSRSTSPDLYVANSWRALEVSPNAGGLARYPIKTLIVVAFALLMVQGLSQLIKHAAFLRGRPTRAASTRRRPRRPRWPRRRPRYRARPAPRRPPALAAMPDGGRLMLGLAMFAAAIGLLLVGFPVAFSLGGTAVLFTLIGSDLTSVFWGIDLPWDPEFRLARLNILPQRIFGTIMDNYTLVAVPFFVFMGVMLEKSGLAEELLETMGMLFGTLRGGLAISVVAVGALLAASTGVVGASVVTMGVLALPVMLKYGYDKPLATGVIASSGTLGQIIPPSIVLVILGDQIGVSVGDLFLGAIVPGVMLAGLFMVWVVVVAIVWPKAAPALPPEARTLHGWRLGLAVLRNLIPPLVLIFLVLGTIFLGVATPTEAGAMGAIGAMALAAVNRRLTCATCRRRWTRPCGSPAWCS
jgi:hypothetical protein